MFLREDENWMRMALREAELAAKEGEIPVGAVIVQNGELISRAHNHCEQNADATAHAEVLAIRAACQALNRWRLEDCTLYVTLEPCPMCAGALINARIKRVVYATADARAGAFGSVIRLPAYPLEARPDSACGLLQEEAQSLLRSFFSDLRKKRAK